MGNTPNKNLPYPENTDKLGGGAGDIKDLAMAVDTELAKSPAVVPISGGGTGATTDVNARTNLKVPFADAAGGIRLWSPSFNRMAYEIPGAAYPQTIAVITDIPSTANFVQKSGDSMYGDLFLPYSSAATSGYTVAYINGDGRVARGASSRRFKKDIEDAGELGDVFPPLREFAWIEGDGTRVLGYIAEELAENPATLRFVVWEEDENGPTDTALAIDVIALLMAQVSTLNQRVAELERRANDGS